MITYRLASENYALDLSGEGAALYGGRWNPAGLRTLYSAQHVSLAILEILVRTLSGVRPQDYYLVILEMPDNSINKIDSSSLKNNWKVNIEYSQWIGEEFLKENESLVLQVPSAIVERENNFVINPFHKDFKKVRIIDHEPLMLDERLMQV
jgi:RES domain-containing protein